MSVALTGVAKRFGAFPAIAGIDLEARAGEFLALLGPSGSGKTTLLRLIAGLELPDAGRISIDGRDMQGVPARERRTGVVFQHYALFRHMTVEANIGFGLRIRPRATRPGRAAIAARVAELLDLVQLPGYGPRYPDQLSGGQRQRVALARALAIEPRVLLLDEPFGALDARVRKDLRRWLRGLHDRMKLTTILVTHDQTEAIEMADRVAVLRAGRVEQVDTPASIWATPGSAFVHGFLGDSVQFDCVVSAGSAHFPGLALAPVPTRLADGPGVAAIRPHDIGLHAAPGGPARVLSVSEVGPVVRIVLALAGREIEATLPAGSAAPSPGATCSLDLGKALIFAARG